MNTRKSGAIAERIAACFLALKGCAILERNYRFHGKEIDLIALEGERVLFVEVKFRRTRQRGLPREAVDRRKRRRIIFAARGFFSERGGRERACRFDVVEVMLEDGGRALRAEHIVGAFDEGAR